MKNTRSLTPLLLITVLTPCVVLWHHFTEEPPIPPAPHVENCMLKLLHLDDLFLVARALLGPGYVGECRVTRGGLSAFCSYYVKGLIDGVPLTNDEQPVGSGCVVMDTMRSSCWYDDPRYPLTDKQHRDMCSDDYIANAAAQLRYGLTHGMCQRPGDQLKCRDPKEP